MGPESSLNEPDLRWEMENKERNAMKNVKILLLLVARKKDVKIDQLASLENHRASMRSVKTRYITFAWMKICLHVLIIVL